MPGLECSAGSEVVDMQCYCTAVTSLPCEVFDQRSACGWGQVFSDQIFLRAVVNIRFLQACSHCIKCVCTHVCVHVCVRARARAQCVCTCVCGACVHTLLPKN